MKEQYCLLTVCLRWCWLATPVLAKLRYYAPSVRALFTPPPLLLWVREWTLQSYSIIHVCKTDKKCTYKFQWHEVVSVFLDAEALWLCLHHMKEIV